MTDFRGLCAELLEKYDLEWRARERIKTALAQPEPQGPTREGILGWLRDDKAWGTVIAPTMWRPEDDELLGLLQRAIARWGRPAIEPVPVAERLPGPEDCLDEGWAWFYTPRGDWVKAVLPVSPAYTHWLPHHALPVPQQEAE